MQKCHANISNKNFNELYQGRAIDNIIGPQPTMPRVFNSQQQWIARYNAQEKDFAGQRMVASYDFIRRFEFASPETLETLQDICRKSWMMTSTHLSYQRNNLSGKVIHHYQSKIVSPEIISLNKIPILRSYPVNEVLKLQSGLLYVRALANDQYATRKDLLKNIETLAQREPRDILFWTPDRDSRDSCPERAFRFDQGDDGFHFDAVIYFDKDVGISYGVPINPSSRHAKK